MVPDVFLNRAHSSVARQLSVWLGVVLLNLAWFITNVVGILLFNSLYFINFYIQLSISSVFYHLKPAFNLFSLHLLCITSLVS